MNALSASEMTVLESYQFSPENRLAVKTNPDRSIELVKVKTKDLFMFYKTLPWGSLNATLKGVTHYLSGKELPGVDTKAYQTIHALAERALYARVDGNRIIPMLWQRLGTFSNVPYQMVEYDLSGRKICCKPSGEKGFFPLSITPFTQYKHLFSQIDMMWHSVSFITHVDGCDEENLARQPFVIHVKMIHDMNVNYPY